MTSREEVKILKEKAIIFFVLCTVVRLLFEAMSENFYVNVSESLPLGLYIKASGKNFCKDDYIVYEPSEEVKEIIIKNGWGDGKRDFLKKVGAVEGEKYSIDTKTLRFEIEGKYIGQVIEKDKVGNELPKLRGDFEVPPNCILPIATSERSFDGRYSGTIPISRIKTRVVPLLTW